MGIGIVMETNILRTPTILKNFRHPLMFTLGYGHGARVVGKEVSEPAVPVTANAIRLPIQRVRHTKMVF
ncbi:hypothetical protein EHZ25_27545 [Paraburkholderia tropica]|nr:hypothetical protein EHZ25_27545 [Paraburkholderia tropica]